MVKPGWWMAYQQLFLRLPKVSSFHGDLTGRTVIVTGANIGLGLEASRHFARMNPGKLILACRDLKKGQAAVESIVKDTSCPNVECWILDLGSFASVTAFADRFEKEGLKLDLLIENAGINASKFAQTKDGWETTLQVNHLATALLALRLLPKLLEAPASPPTPRLIIVASEVHHFVSGRDNAVGPDLLGRLNVPEPPSKFEAMGNRYLVSKLFNVLFVRALVARIRDPGPLTINSLNPGFCKSSLGREIEGNFFWWLAQSLLARSTEVGSRTLVHAGIGMDIQGKTGEYLTACMAYEADDFVLSETGRKLENQLWEETMAVLAKVDPKVVNITEKYLS